MALVHVLTFAPSQKGGSFPGFDWALASESGQLKKEYRSLVKESSEDGSMIVRLLELTLDARDNDEELIIDEIDDILSSDHGHSLPAVEQYVPENADPEMIPTS